MNLSSILQHAVRSYPRRQAVNCGDCHLTYAELGSRVLRLSHLLAEEGAGPHAPVAILHRNCHHFLETYFAAGMSNTILVPLNHRLTDREIASILADSHVYCFLTEGAFTTRAKAIIDNMSASHRPGILSWTEGPRSIETRLAALPEPILPELSLAENPIPDSPLPDSLASDHDPAQLYYTSGTTGTPKGVILTHENVTSHARAVITELDMTEQDVWLHAAPMFHLADAWATWAITWVGGRHVMLPDFEPDQFFNVVAAEGVTITNLIPTMLVRLVHHPQADPAKLRSMRLILSGGAPMALELLKQVEALFPCEYVQTYGLTETSPYLTLSLLTEKLRRLPPAEQQRYRATTGRPLRGVDVRVVDAAGQPVPWDGQTVGEIVARGPTVTPGYFQRAEENARAFKGGWLHTGDLAHVDPEGYLTIVDRSKDVINTGGELVYSTEVENTLYGHPAVQEAAVIAVPDRKWGEVVHAVVVPTEGHDCWPDDLIAHCKIHLAGFKVPQSIEIRDELPKTGSGKLDKKTLRAPFWEGEDKQVR